jgi:S-formylglutathione hydrolase FrmB/lysophospholipase L1-like esterase
MKRLFCLILFIILITGSAWCAEKDILTITHFSDCLNKEKTFKVYFPPDAKKGEKFPVLFILHGAYGGHEDWIAQTDVENLADKYRMILVFPDGSPFGWYVDSTIEKDMKYETYVSKELVSLVDKLFPAVSEKEGRGIMGLSMGGHGALLLAVKNPEIFGSASSLSGILKISNHAKKWHISGRLGPLDENPEAWKANSVWDQAESFKDSGIDIMFDCGEDDTKTGAIGDARELHDKLNNLNIPHIWREMPGTHSWKYWQKHLEEHLNFHQTKMKDLTPGLGRWRGLYFNRLEEFFDENAKLSLEKPEKTTLCLLGSSSCQGFSNSLLPEYKIYNRGISADALGIGPRGITHRMESCVFDMKPDYIFIKTGRNDLGDRRRNGEPSIERMIEEYDKILTQIKERMPETKVCIVTCAPVRGKYANLATPTLSYNNEIKILAKKHDVLVLDLHKKLIGEDGLLKEEYSRDGLHITKAGYQVWADMIKKEISKKQED